jgi:hypothetical protein
MKGREEWEGYESGKSDGEWGVVAGKDLGMEVRMGVHYSMVLEEV